MTKYWLKFLMLIVVLGTGTSTYAALKAPDSTVQKKCDVEDANGTDGYE
jgi:hypothetical protein